jgi:hypothetical protein
VCIYSQNIPFGQMINSQPLLSLSLVLVKPSIIWISSSLLSAIYNCQDVFRKNSQNGIAQDWQTMRRIFEEIWSNRVIDTISQVIDMLFSRPYSTASLIMLGLLRRTCPLLTVCNVRRTLYLSLLKETNIWKYCNTTSEKFWDLQFLANFIQNFQHLLQILHQIVRFV